MFKKKNQSGFVLLEVLIAVIVILGLTIWWVKAQDDKRQTVMAQKTSQQMNEIFNALMNYYEQAAPVVGEGPVWPPHVALQELIDDKYLLSEESQNIFGLPYTLQADDVNKLEILTTQIPRSDVKVALEAIKPLTNASVTGYNDSTGPVTITWKIPMPAALQLTDATAVHYMTTATDGDFISSGVISCPNDQHYKKQIFTAIQACNTTDAAGTPIEGCQSYATEDVSGNVFDGWHVHLRVLTSSGWASDTNNQIQVSVKCLAV